MPHDLFSHEGQIKAIFMVKAENLFSDFGYVDFLFLIEIIDRVIIDLHTMIPYIKISH